MGINVSEGVVSRVIPQSLCPGCCVCLENEENCVCDKQRDLDTINQE